MYLHILAKVRTRLDEYCTPDAIPYIQVPKVG